VISLLTFLGVLVVRGVCVNVLVGDVILNVQSNGLLGDTEITISSHLTMQRKSLSEREVPRFTPLATNADSGGRRGALQSAR